MTSETASNIVAQVKSSVPLPKIYHFDIFKGEKDEKGTVRKLRTIGEAIHAEGQKTFKIRLKTFRDDEFFLLPEKRVADVDFTILTRRTSEIPGKKYLWDIIGEAKILSEENSGFMQLEWDLLPKMYMNLSPKELREPHEEASLVSA